jgi:hypothetical protein
MNASACLQRWLEQRLDGEGRRWLEAALVRVAGATGERDLYLLASQAARRVGKAPLALDAQALRDATSARPGWDPRDWTVDNAARILLLLHSATDPAELARRLDRLCLAADVDELVAWYRGLPLYADGPRYVLRAAEGVRSNMRVVFEAVAHRNPYPAEHFTEPAWNQMVLKALFVGSRLEPVTGLDARRNPALAAMLVHYAHERWAARRSVSPELWRCVGPYATGAVLDDLRRVLEHGDAEERSAARAALRESPEPRAAQLLAAVG